MLLKQEALLKAALIEENIDIRNIKIEIDHNKGRNFVNDIELGIIYPKSFFDKAFFLHKILNKKIDFYFNGNISENGGRKALLEPFYEQNSKIVKSNFGRIELFKSKFNLMYFYGLSNAFFGLCPHQKNWDWDNDYKWTYRFIESLMTFSIPIVFREACLGYRFIEKYNYIYDDVILKSKNPRELYSLNDAKKNFNLAMENFTLNEKQLKDIIK